MSTIAPGLSEQESVSRRCGGQEVKKVAVQARKALTQANMARMLLAISVVTRDMAEQIIQADDQSQFKEGGMNHEPYERPFRVRQ